MSLLPGSDTSAVGLAGDTQPARGELIQGVKPTGGVTESFSPAELVFCKVRSWRDLTGSLAGCAGVGTEAARGRRWWQKAQQRLFKCHLSLDLGFFIVKMGYFDS